MTKWWKSRPESKCISKNGDMLSPKPIGFAWNRPWDTWLSIKTKVTWVLTGLKDLHRLKRCFSYRPISKSLLDRSYINRFYVLIISNHYQPKIMPFTKKICEMVDLRVDTPSAVQPCQPLPPGVRCWSWRHRGPGGCCDHGHRCSSRLRLRSDHPKPEDFR